MKNIKNDARQKMMSLMYLVLIVLLGLQVSDSHLENFETMNEILEERTQEALEVNIEAVQEIKTLADSLKTDLAKERKELAENLRNKTKSLFDSIAILKTKLIEEIGEGYDLKNQNIREKRAVTEVESFMIGEGQGRQLEKALDDYVDELNQEYKYFLRDKLPKITEKKGNYSDYENEIIQPSPHFVERYFENSSIVEAVLVLSLFQYEIVKYEEEVLTKLGATVKYSEALSCERIIAIAAPKFTVLLSDDWYMLDIFLSSSIINSKPDYYFNQSPVFIEDGIGKVNFLISSDITEPTIVPWEAEVKYIDPNTRKSNSHIIEGEYYIDFPTLWQEEIKIPLYEKCINPIEVSSIHLLKYPTIDFEVSEGAKLIKSTELGKFTLIPDGTQQEITVRMLKNESVLDSMQFQVQEVPLPSLVLTDKQGKELDISKPIAADSKYLVKVIPDEGFQSILPQEANYKIDEMEVIQIRDAEVLQVENFTSEHIDMQRFDTKAGDIFQLVVKDISRISTQFGKVPITLKQAKLGFIIKSE